MTPLKINFDKGTLILQNVPEALESQLPDLRWDERTLTFRAPAYHYRHIVSQLRAHDITYQDTARQFTVESFAHQKRFRLTPTRPRRLMHGTPTANAGS